MRKHIVLLLVLAGWLAGHPDVLQAQTSANRTIAYQGFLSNEQNEPIEDAALPMRFTLHNELIGGSALWNETHSSVQVNNGVFTVRLGSIEPLAGVPFDRPLFLTVTVGNNSEEVTLSPRIPLTAVGYSLRAGSLDDEALTAGENISLERVDGAIQISAAGAEAGVPSKLSAPDGNPAEAVVVTSSGNVGIGTSVNEVASPLHVRSAPLGLGPNTLATPATIAAEADDAIIALMSDGNGDIGSTLLLGEMTQKQLSDLWSIGRKTSSGGKSALHFAYGTNFKFTNNAPRLVLTANGELGLGPDSPEAELHLSGTGDTEIILEADTDNNNETDNPGILFRQDGNAVNAFIGLEGKGGGRASGTLDNAFVIGSEDNDPALQFVTNDKVQLTIGTDGKLSRPERTETLIVTGGELLPTRNYGGMFFRSPINLRLADTGDQRWIKQISLPDGAVLRKVTVGWLQSSFGNDTKDMTIRLLREDAGGFASDRVTMAILDAKDSEGPQESVDTTIQEPVIDNRHVYYIEVEFPVCPNAPIFNSCDFSIGRMFFEYTTTGLN